MQHFLDGSEKEEYEKFSALHFVNCLSNVRLHYTSVDIGTVIEVECLGCKEKKDITDYGSW